MCSPIIISTFVSSMMINYSGLVRGGSGGSADPQKILEPEEKKLEIDILR